MSVDDTKDKMDKLVRTIYYSAKQLEENYSGAKEAVRMAEETLRVTKVKYDVGMATNSELLNAELALVQAKQSLLDISCNHEILKMAFEMPWAYAGASS